MIWPVEEPDTSLCQSDIEVARDSANMIHHSLAAYSAGCGAAFGEGDKALHSTHSQGRHPGTMLAHILNGKLQVFIQGRPTGHRMLQRICCLNPGVGSGIAFNEARVTVERGVCISLCICCSCLRASVSCAAWCVNVCKHLSSRNMIAEEIQAPILVVNRDAVESLPGSINVTLCIEQICEVQKWWTRLRLLQNIKTATYGEAAGGRGATAENISVWDVWLHGPVLAEAV